MSTEPTEAPEVDYFYDEESRNWHFRAPALGVTGGGDATPEAAQRHAADAIAFTLACRRDEQADRPAGPRRAVGWRYREFGAGVEVRHENTAVAEIPQPVCMPRRPLAKARRELRPDIPSAAHGPRSLASPLSWRQVPRTLTDV
jgi:hypothetical protein